MSEQQRQVFNTTVGRGIFPTKRDIPDIQTDIPYLSTIVKYANTDYWKKLRCMTMYLVGKKEIVIQLKWSK